MSSSTRTLVKFGHVSSTSSRCDFRYRESDEEDLRYFRLFGLFAAFCSIGFTAVALISNRWRVGPEGFSTGLWDNCTYNVTNNQTSEICSDSITNSQCVLVVIFLFALVFAVLATYLATSGVCSEHLLKKLYYFHSSAEIYFVCGMLCLSALIIFTLMTEIEHQKSRPSAAFKFLFGLGGGSKQSSPRWIYSYGAGYFIAWLAVLFYSLSALTMCIDDLMTSCLLMAQRRKQKARNRHFQHQLQPYPSSAVAAAPDDEDEDLV